MIAFGYARVSTADKEQDPAPQLEEMREYCRRQDWTLTEFVDRISSGKARPELERMLSEIRRGRGHVLLCRHFDRIARTARELVLLAEELVTLNVTFISLNQQIDTRTPMGKFSFTVLAAAAELERSMIRERVKLGLASARKELERTGLTHRGKTRFAGRPRAAVDPHTVASMRAAGRTVAQIAQHLKVSSRTVRRVLQNAGKVAKNPAPKHARK